MAGKAVALNAALAAFIGTQEWFVAVAVHGVGFALVTEETGGAGELEVFAAGDFAFVGF